MPPSHHAMTVNHPCALRHQICFNLPQAAGNPGHQDPPQMTAVRCLLRGLSFPPLKGNFFFPTTSYSLVTKQAVTRGLLTKWVIPFLSLTGTTGSASFVVVVLWLPDLSRFSPSFAAASRRGPSGRPPCRPRKSPQRKRPPRGGGG